MNEFVTERLKGLSEEKRRALLFGPIFIGVGVIAVFWIFTSNTEEAGGNASPDKGNGMSLELPEAKENPLDKDKTGLVEEYERHMSSKSKRDNDFFTVHDEWRPTDRDSLNTEKLDTVPVRQVVTEERSSTRNSSKRATRTKVDEDRKGSVEDIEDPDGWKESLKRRFEESLAEGSNEPEEPSVMTDTQLFAVIDGDQEITNGDRVRLRLIRDAVVEDVPYERNTFVYAIATLRNKRVKLNVTSVGNDPLKSRLSAYDAQDGLEGVYVSDLGLMGEAKGELVDDAVQEATNAADVPGGRTLGGLFQRRNREVKVFLINDYKVTLMSSRR